MSENAELVIANTLRIAKDDLEAAKALLNAGNRSAAYHLEQAAEKVLKAILTSEGQTVARHEQHELRTIVAKISDANPLKK